MMLSSQEALALSVEIHHDRDSHQEQEGTLMAGTYPEVTTTARASEADVGNLYLDGCPCREVLDLIGSRWSVLVIGQLESSPARFGELGRAVPGISQKMLTRTLRRLEEDGLIHREVLSHMRPPRVEYSLTDLGQTITEPLAAIRHWTEQHLPDVRVARARFADHLRPPPPPPADR